MNILVIVKVDDEQAELAMQEALPRVGQDIEVAVESILVVELDRVGFRSLDITVECEGMGPTVDYEDYDFTGIFDILEGRKSKQE